VPAGPATTSLRRSEDSLPTSPPISSPEKDLLGPARTWRVAIRSVATYSRTIWPPLRFSQAPRSSSPSSSFVRDMPFTSWRGFRTGTDFPSPEGGSLAMAGLFLPLIPLSAGPVQSWYIRGPGQRSGYNPLLAPPSHALTGGRFCISHPSSRSGPSYWAALSRLALSLTFTSYSTSIPPGRRTRHPGEGGIP
jgi:hypothetical protein